MKNIILVFLTFFCCQSIEAQPNTWQTRGIGGGGALFSPAINPANPNEIYMGCNMTELFHTTNQGATWQEMPFQQIQGGLFSEVQFTQDPNIRYCVNHAAKDNVDRLRPFKTDDNGATWYPLIAPINEGAGVLRLFADYNSPSRIVLADYNQIFFSTNGGGSFTKIYETANATIGNHIAGVCFDQQNIYICGENGIFYSNNNGNTWTSLATQGLATDEKILSFTWARTGDSLKFVCLTANRVWSGIRPGSTFWESMRGIFTMMNANGSWQRHTTGINSANGDYVVWLGMAQNDTSTVYAAGGNGYLKPIVMKSVNSAAWQHVFFNQNNQNIATGWSGHLGDHNWDYGGAPQGFKVCASNANIIVSTDMGFTHISTNGGNTWKQMYLNSADQNTMNVTTPKKKNYRSNGLENTTSWHLTWLNAQKMVGSFSDICGIISADSGSSWKFLPYYENTTYRTLQHNNGTIYTATSSVHDLYQSNRIYDQSIDAGTGKIYFSRDNSLTFNILKNFNHPIVWIALDPNTPSVMYASVLHSDTAIGGIYRTTNLQDSTNATWTKLANPTRANGHPFNIHVLNNGDLVASFSARAPTVSSQFEASSGVFYFNQATQTWADRSHSNMRFWTKDITLDPSDATQSTWYAAVFQGWGNVAMQGTGGLYRTNDKGLTWTKISNEFRVNSATVHPTNPQIVYYTTETNGLWYTTNALSNTPNFERVENYTFRHPIRVFFNPFNINELWTTSFGNGLKMGVQNSVLPLSILDFSGNTQAEGNLLYWHIQGMHEAQNIVLEKSDDAQKFTPLSIITHNELSYLDKNILPINYYRLKVNYNNHYIYSKIIALKKDNYNENIIVYPNPTNDILFIKNVKHTEGGYITNAQGQIILNISANSHQLDISQLPKGIYFLIIDNKSIKFLKE